MALMTALSLGAAPVTAQSQPAPDAEPEAAPLAVPPSDSPSDSPSASPSAAKSAAWISIGIGFAAATVGGVMVLSARSTEEDLRDLVNARVMGTPAQYQGAARDQYNELIAEGQRFDTLAAVAFGVAGAAAVTATVLFILDAKAEKTEGPRRAWLAPQLGEAGTGVAAGLRF